MRRTQLRRKDLTKRSDEFSPKKQNSRNKTRNKWRLQRPHGQERSLVKREMALAEVRRREVAKKLFPFRPQVLRRIFTGLRRIALMRSRASWGRCLFRREKPLQNASRKLTKITFTFPRTG